MSYWNWNHTIKYDTKKQVIRESISDCIGNDIEIGTIIAYSTTPKQLSFGVYEGVALVEHLANDKVYKTSCKVQVCVGTKNGKVRRSTFGVITKTEEGFTAPQNIVVIKNPIYHIQNEKLARCLIAIDKLKDQNFLPKDFSII